MNKWCTKSGGKHENSVTCVAWDKLKNIVATAINKIAKMINMLTPDVDLQIMWDTTMEALDELKRQVDRAMTNAKKAADKWVKENIGENLDDARAALGDVSIEKIENVVYLPEEYRNRDGTYIKVLDCTFDDNKGSTVDGWDWDSNPDQAEITQPYWKCKACADGKRKDCTATKNTEVGLKPKGGSNNKYFWRPDEPSDEERGFGLFFSCFR